MLSYFWDYIIIGILFNLSFFYFLKMIFYQEKFYFGKNKPSTTQASPQSFQLLCVLRRPHCCHLGACPLVPSGTGLTEDEHLLK